jgi:hypothetical protein
MGGGLSSDGELAPGEKWDTTLRMGSFVPALRPGEYTVRVMYHDSVCIADEEDGVDGLVVSWSGAIRLRVKPLVFSKEDVDGEKVAGLLSRIDGGAKLKVVSGTYGEWAHDFVALDSAQGKLLAMGLRAVPPLLEKLEEPQLTPGTRAVVLSLLFSLTGQNDPREPGGVLGGYDSAQGPWVVWGGGGGAVGWSRSSGAAGAEIDASAQKEFAKVWGPWKEYVRVTK